MRKAWSLILEDVRSFITGRAVVGISDTEADPWAYPTEWSRTLRRADYYFGPFDTSGTPQWLVGDVLHYNPSRIAGYALALWNVRDDWAAGGGRRAFMACADWFAAQPEARFEYRFAGAGLEPPWLSCIAQGQGASVLVRAFLLTDQRTYLDRAIAATKWLIKPVADGGLLDSLPDGSLFFEEYPGSYPHVLNGCLHALVGLEDLDRVGSLPPEVKAIGMEVLEGVSANLSAWDVDGWSTYDFAPEVRRANLNTVNYHAAHIALLVDLAKRSGDPVMTVYAEKWRKSLSNPLQRMSALKRKIEYRLVEAW